MEKERLNLGITTAAAHIGHSQEGASLRTNIAAVVVELGLVLEHRLGINLLVVRAEALAGIHEKLLGRQRIHIARVRHEVRRRIGAGADGLLVVLFNAARIILCVSEAIDLHSSVLRLH